MTFATLQRTVPEKCLHGTVRRFHREVGMSVDPSPAPVIVQAIDDMLRLCEFVRGQRHRDPMRALENLLLEMRTAAR